MQCEPQNPCHVFIKEEASDKWAILISQPYDRNCAQPGDPLLTTDKSEVGGSFMGLSPFPVGSVFISVSVRIELTCRLPNCYHRELLGVGKSPIRLGSAGTPHSSSSCYSTSHTEIYFQIEPNIFLKGENTLCRASSSHILSQK